MISYCNRKSSFCFNFYLCFHIILKNQCFLLFFNQLKSTTHHVSFFILHTGDRGNDGLNGLDGRSGLKGEPGW